MAVVSKKRLRDFVTLRMSDKRYSGGTKSGIKITKNPREAGFLKSGSSDWTRTSSVSPVINDFVKLNYIFTNIFTIIIVFLSIKCQLKTIGCCHNYLTIRILFHFHYQYDVVIFIVKVIDIKQLVII